MTKGKKRLIGCGVVVAVLAILCVATPAGRAVVTLVKTLVQTRDTNESEAFKGDTADRLKAMLTAADLYHQSEDAYPMAKSWMDDLLTRLQTQNLKPGEANKKIKRPEFDGDPSKFGFAMNQDLSGKYKGDIAKKDTILFFESVKTEKNAVGDPEIDKKPGGQGITLEGKLVSL